MTYLDKINALYKAGNATEHSYRPALKEYLEKLLPNITATNEPKRQKCGAPDYIITRHTRGNAIDIGYIEAKDVGKNLDEIENDEQLTRYRESLDNLILTDYLDFRFFLDGKKVAQVRIGHALMGQIQYIPENIDKLETLLRDFAAFKGQTITSAKNLAVMMARKAKLMQEVFFRAILQEDEHTGLKEQLQAFRKILIHDMEATEFADVYAQTITYGLFTARLHDTTLEDFSRTEALNLIPASNPFLRKLFQYVAVDMDDSIAWIVDALCELLRATDIHDIMKDFGKQSGRNDPIVNFYETFLAEYNPALRKSRGVWYTPEPVVNFIIRAVDDCLKTHFNLPLGLADTSKVKIKTETIDNSLKKGTRTIEKEVHKVQLLDVASGTGTFIAEVIKQIYNGHFQHQQGMWSDYVEQHLLPRLHGFEILMASYAMCHMKIELLLEETGYKPKNAKKPPRLGVYLTNSLEEAHPDAETLFASWLSAEANEANMVKRETPVMVAFGNPPYNNSSQNKGVWIQNLIKDYKKGLNEKKVNLDDDYIKFIRYAEHYVEKTGYGVVAMITNNSFLDGVTHRQMRKHLLSNFDSIYIYNLHGDVRGRIEGNPDKNVFDITQGVSIGIFVKHKIGGNELAEVYYHEIYGSRESKYAELWEKRIQAKDFQKLHYEKPYYFYLPKTFEIKNDGIKIDELFKVLSSGIQTKNDPVAIHWTAQDLDAVINDFLDDKLEILEKKYPNKKVWKAQHAQSDLRKKEFVRKTILYRPFDFRKTALTTKSGGFLGRPRYEVMQHFNKENIGLIVNKKFVGSDFSYAGITRDIIAHGTFYLGNRGQDYLCPLYLYPTQDEQLTLGDKKQRVSNLNKKIVAQIAKKLGIPSVPDHEDKKADDKTAFSPLDLLDYIYAVLHSPSYRETYKEFLKIDFPRIPYPQNAKTFWQLVVLGREIRLLHLLESPALGKFITRYPVSGDNTVEKPEYKNGTVYINKDQYFEGVPEVAWNFYIGGYQPAQKWLKDRKGRQLNFEDITHYQKIIIALTETDRLMKEIDAVWKP